MSPDIIAINTGSDWEYHCRTVDPDDDVAYCDFDNEDWPCAAARGKTDA